MSTVIFCGSEHCPADTIVRELEATGTKVIRLDTSHFGHDSDAIAQQVVALAESASEPVGCAGSASAGAGAILAAVQRPDLISAVVSINGRTDLAMDALRSLRTPSLLLVNDMPVLRMNREAVSQIRCERRIEVVHGDGPEACRALAEKTARWFADRFAPVPA